MVIIRSFPVIKLLRLAILESLHVHSGKGKKNENEKKRYIHPQGEKEEGIAPGFEHGLRVIGKFNFGHFVVGFPKGNLLNGIGWSNGPFG